MDSVDVMRKVLKGKATQLKSVIAGHERRIDGLQREINECVERCEEFQKELGDIERTLNLLDDQRSPNSWADPGTGLDPGIRLCDDGHFAVGTIDADEIMLKADFDLSEKQREQVAEMIRDELDKRLRVDGETLRKQLRQCVRLMQRAGKVT